MKRPGVRTRFWIELGLAIGAGTLTVLTVLVHDWAEVLFHLDPDQGSGVFEVAVLLVMLGFTVALTISTQFEWRRRTSARAGG